MGDSFALFWMMLIPERSDGCSFLYVSVCVGVRETHVADAFSSFFVVAKNFVVLTVTVVLLLLFRVLNALFFFSSEEALFA
jgi:hypothetical protein